MPDIYSDGWYQAIIELANSRDDLSSRVPAGEWRVAIELEGDGLSPYVPPGTTRYWFIRLVDGKMLEFREAPGKIPGQGLQYRFIGPAHVFEGVAAGVLDPVEVGLNGTITVRGDMRLLMQHAELTNVIFEVYAHNNVTEWSAGKPPYK
ncbi:MAG: hypothetical protein KKB20_18365 [Proteobacteria bacterium]|nr:hypothetical protein [Pseudomonadota bacterium]